MMFTSWGGILVCMRLLVVEDEARLALLLKRGLEEQGYVVDVTGDGAEALWLATEADYGAIVLDVMLPGLDGLEVTRRLRASEQWAPVLLLTARDGIDDRVAGLDAGADDYLVKPFSFAELAARVRALVRRSQAERPAVLEVGELRLDPAPAGVARPGPAGAVAEGVCAAGAVFVPSG
jgi:two-component system OmpR family response regulator